MFKQEGEMCCKLYELQLDRYRAKRLRFFINGDKFFTGINYALNTEKIRSFDALLNDLTRLLADHICLSKGVRFIFDLRGQLVSTLESFVGGSIYLCSSSESYIPMEYNVCHGKMNWLIRNSNFISSAPKSRKLRARATLNNETPDSSALTTSINGLSRLSPLPSKPRNGANARAASVDRASLVHDRESRKLNGVSTPLVQTQHKNRTTNLNQNSSTTKATKPSSSTKYPSAKATPSKPTSQETISNGVLHNKTNQSRVATKNGKISTPPAVRTPVAAHKATTPAHNNNTGTNNNNNNNKKLENIVEKTQANSESQQQKDHNAKPNPMMTISRLVFPEEVMLKYDVGRPIGDGHFSVVYCCMNKSNQQFCALKLIDKLKCRGKEDMIYNEVNILKRLKHANIVTLIEEFDYSKQLYLILELVQDGDLFDAISTVTKFNEPDVATMIFNLSSALTYLHSQGIVHRDIKPENLLISVQEDGSQSVKLADFGLAVEVTGPLYTVCGTAFYVSPEMLSETGYEYKVDVWSTGIICFILLCGYPPFSSENEADQDELFDAILAGEFTFASPYWDRISIYAKDLIRAMLTAEPEKRYSAEQVFNHPWTRGETTNFKGLNSMNISRTLTLKSVQ